MAADPIQLAAEIKHKAVQLGFDRVGIASAQASNYRDYFRQWIDDGRGGTMNWLAARFAERVDPAIYMPGAKSVICVAVNYFVPLATQGNSPSPGTPGEGWGEGLQNTRDCSGPHPNPLPVYRERGQEGRVARYALGDDYHEIIKPRLHKLADWIHTVLPKSQTRCAVDTAPVMEKELAARAGVGWLGKNTCIINDQIGSWLFLGEILTDLDLPHDSPAIDRCGTCTRCIDACPTGAITAPYQLDATRCISYLTIEHRGEIPTELQRQMGDWIYGCDVCQDVCPWNRRAPATAEPALSPRFKTGTIELSELETWGDVDYQRNLKQSAMKRVKLPVLQRNVHIAAANASAGNGR